MPPDMPPPQWEASLQVRSDEKYPGSQLLCSFSSQANFTKAFVRWLGISPGRYRRACAFPMLPLRADSAAEMFGYPIPAL
jgi:hypothetical protein